MDHLRVLFGECHAPCTLKITIVNSKKGIHIVASIKDYISRSFPILWNFPVPIKSRCPAGPVSSSVYCVITISSWTFSSWICVKYVPLDAKQQTNFNPIRVGVGYNSGILLPSPPTPTPIKNACTILNIGISDVYMVLKSIVRQYNTLSSFSCEKR
jgi:hypothetical protein